MVHYPIGATGRLQCIYFRSDVAALDPFCLKFSLINHPIIALSEFLDGFSRFNQPTLTVIYAAEFIIE